MTKEDRRNGQPRTNWHKRRRCFSSSCCCQCLSWWSTALSLPPSLPPIFCLRPDLSASPMLIVLRSPKGGRVGQLEECASAAHARNNKSGDAPVHLLQARRTNGVCRPHRCTRAANLPVLVVPVLRQRRNTSIISPASCKINYSSRSIKAEEGVQKHASSGLNLELLLSRRLIINLSRRRARSLPGSDESAASVSHTDSSWAGGGPG
jgi:hypothetical protein